MTTHTSGVQFGGGLARDRVARTRQALLAIVMARALAAGVAAALTVWGALTLLLVFTGGVGRTWAAALAVVVGLVTGVTIARRAGGPRLRISAVALWIEEQVPALQYALVTAVEQGAAMPALQDAVRRRDWMPEVRRAASRSLRWPVAALVVSMLAAFAAQAVRPALRNVAASRGDGTRGADAVRGTLDVVARVAPPAYARLPQHTVRNPATLRALEGSLITFEAAGDSLRGRLDRASLEAMPAGPGRLSLRLGTQALALRLEGRGGSRLVALEPIPDSAPSVVLRLPARDTVLREPRGSVSLGADVRDDLGLRHARFEYIVSSGEGETFTFKSGVLGARALGGARQATLEGTMALDALDLEAGDVVHLRAIALDTRDDTARGIGSSETRTLRIARVGEFDSVAVEAAAPPEADKSLLSQRMLINLTEALIRRRPTLADASFREESRRIARDQARLRRQVGEMVFARLGDDPSGEHFHGDGHDHAGQELRPAMTPEELLKAADNATAAAAGQTADLHDDSPIVAINRPLLEAYNAMWDAGRELEQAAPRAALPHMYRALAAIQRARAAERLYLRSRPPRAVVDIDRVRLQGKDRGDPVERDPRDPTALRARDVLARFSRVVTLVVSEPGAAADSLLLLRIDVLERHPTAASALGDAAEALRAGRDVTPALQRARRALDPSAGAADSLSRWSGAR